MRSLAFPHAMRLYICAGIRLLLLGLSNGKWDLCHVPCEFMFTGLSVQIDSFPPKITLHNLVSSPYCIHYSNFLTLYGFRESLIINYHWQKRWNQTMDSENVSTWPLEELDSELWPSIINLTNWGYLNESRSDEEFGKCEKRSFNNINRYTYNYYTAYILVVC